VVRAVSRPAQRSVHAGLAAAHSHTRPAAPSAPALPAPPRSLSTLLTVSATVCLLLRAEAPTSRGL
jgi:hypothetical protein